VKLKKHTPTSENVPTNNNKKRKKKQNKKLAWLPPFIIFVIRA